MNPKNNTNEREVTLAEIKQTKAEVLAANDPIPWDDEWKKASDRWIDNSPLGPHSKFKYWHYRGRAMMYNNARELREFLPDVLDNMLCNWFPEFAERI